MTVSILDISGPVMVGPSSSHTAGAIKLGQFARAFLGHTPDKVEIFLHGSFGTVYKGHATDKALIAGLLNMSTDDKDIKYSFDKAHSKNMKFKLIPCSLGVGFHPNTARFIMWKDKKKLTVTGSSVGGGSIVISEINGFEINLKESMGITFTIIVMHQDAKGVLHTITSALSTKNNNLASVQSIRMAKFGEAITIIETDEKISIHTLKKIKEKNSFIQSIFELN